MKHRFKVMVLSSCLLFSAPAKADGVGDVTALLGNLLGGGSVGSAITALIPGIGPILAGLGPIMGLIDSIPGLSGLLSGIPGLGPLLGLIGGLGGGASMTPLSKQIKQITSWISTAQQLKQTAANLLRPNNFNDFASGISGLLQQAGVKTVITPAQVKANPQDAAKTALNALSSHQQTILNRLNQAASFGERDAYRAQADALQQLKSRIQHSADNADTLNNTTDVMDQAQQSGQDSLLSTNATAQELLKAKKVEDSTRLLGSAMIEQVHLTATSMTATLAALANQTKVQVAQAETLGQLLNEVQQERLQKAAAITAVMERQRKEAEHQADRIQTLTKNLTDGMNSSMTGESLKGVDLLGGP